jgi:hypothetical protein
MIFSPCESKCLLARYPTPLRILPQSPPPIPLPFRDCVAIMTEGRYVRNRQSRSSALECGHLELWVIELLAKAIFSCACSPVADR